MSGIMEVVELLRPFVETKAWEYVVVWKYGNDPTSFIEWMGCCCCGGNIEKQKIKEEMSEKYKMAPICRDTLFPHPVRTKTCETLAKLPFAKSLYSSVHGEAAISQQPIWLIQENSIGTQVLIPILGGLVELFTTKLIPKDINIVEFISVQCCVSMKQEAISTQSYTNVNFNELYYPLTSGLSTENHSSSNPSIEGPFNGSNPSKEHLSFDSKFDCLVPREYLNQPFEISPIPKDKSHGYNKTLSFNCGNGEEDKEETVKEPQKEMYHAKNLITERNRRNRIKKGLFTLRSLVPNISKFARNMVDHNDVDKSYILKLQKIKMDRAAILDDAIEYIKELQRQKKELQKEVDVLDVEDCKKNTLQMRVQGDKEEPLSELNQSSSDSIRKTQMELQIEVNHVCGTDFMIKLCCEMKRGEFSKLMEAIDAIGLRAVNANMTTFDGKVLIILMVEATAQEIHPTKLREYLKQQTS